MQLTFDYTPPLDADALLGHFSRRAVPGIEAVGDRDYVRSLRLPGGPAAVQLTFATTDTTTHEPVRARLALADPADRDAAVARVRALLDLDADPAPVHELLGADELLGAAVRAAPGRRVVGAADPTELTIRAMLGQQISLAGAAHAGGRLVSAYGTELPAAARLDGPLGESVTHLFPDATALAAADPARLRMPAARARAIVATATALASGDVVLRRGGDSTAARAALLALPGIGPWTADYVRIRVLGDHDVLLASDLGVRRAFEHAGMAADARAIAAVAERWRPYRAYAQEYVWSGLGG